MGDRLGAGAGQVEVLDVVGVAEGEGRAGQAFGGEVDVLTVLGGGGDEEEVLVQRPVAEVVGEGGVEFHHVSLRNGD